VHSIFTVPRRLGRFCAGCLLAFIGVWSFWGGAAPLALASGEKIAVYKENPPSGNYLEAGHLKGPAVRIVQEIMRRLSIDAAIEIVPWARGYDLARTRPNVALFSTSRLPQREAQFKWVGPLYTQRWGFYALRKSPLHFGTLAEAGQIARIGTYHEDAKEQYLKALGFGNLVCTNNNIGNVRHLMEGEIDVWGSSNFNMPFIPRSAGYDPRDLKLVMAFKTVGNDIAFSPQTADPIVREWQTALDDLRRDLAWSADFGPTPVADPCIRWQACTASPGGRAPSA
jgi:polar amino acid transport system substrate-binding protein